MMKEGGISHQGNEFHPYANGNMQQHMYNNSRQTPDSGLGNESMNNAGGGENSGAPVAGGAPPGFQPNPYYMGNAHQSQYNEQQQQQQQYRHKPYNGGQQEGGRFERSTGPPSIVTMHTSPPNMDQDGAPSFNPNYAYSQYGNQGGQQYGGMDRNYNAPHPMTARSHSNYSESSSSTLNMPPGGPPDPSVLSGPPLMAGPHGSMMYAQQGGTMGPPFPHPQMQQGGPFMFNPAMQAHQQLMQGGQMGQQQGGPGMHPQGIPMQPQQSAGGMPPGPPQSTSPPHPGMMMMGQPGAPMHPSQGVYYPHHPAMMAQRGPVVGQGPDGFVQFTYPANLHAAAAVQHQGGFMPMRAPMMHQRSLNSPAPSDNTDGQSVHGGGGASIGMWQGPPDQSSQQNSPPGGMQPMQMQPMQPGMMMIQQHPMMTASYPGTGGVAYGGPASAPRMIPAPPYSHQQLQQMAMQHAMMQSQGMQQMHPQMQQQLNVGGFPPQPPQPQSGYWQGPPQGGRGGYRGGHRGGRGGHGGNRPNSRQYNSRNNSIASGGRGRDAEEMSKCTTPTEEEIDMSNQMESMRMDESMEGGQGGHNGGQRPCKQLLQLADPKSSSPPAEPHPSDEDGVMMSLEGQEEGGTNVSVPTTLRTEPRKELLEMKKTPNTDNNSSQSIPVDPVPPHGECAPSTTMKWSEAKPCCLYCKGKQYPVDEYTNHNLWDGNKVVTCPRLRLIGCSYCKTKGDKAHETFLCPARMAEIGVSSNPADENTEDATQAHLPSHSDHATQAHLPSHSAHLSHHTHSSHPIHSNHGDREGGYRGGPKRGGGGGNYNRGRGGGGGGYGGERKYDNRRML